MTMWESWCFYVGEIATWVVPMLAAMAYGYWIHNRIPPNWGSFILELSIEITK